MNKRIHELAEQAGLNHERWTTTEEFETFLENFAHLVAQDCISQVAMIGVSNYDNNDITWTVDLAIKHIRQHLNFK